MVDNLKIAAAVACVIAGIWGYYYFADTALVLRVLMVMGGLIAAGGVAWLSTPGKEFFAFAQEAWQEAGRVSWPTRKETVQTTLIVFAFVVVMALILFSIDSTLAWIVKLLTGRSEG
jgi:preprotein translocase subunit SecE